MIRRLKTGLALVGLFLAAILVRALSGMVLDWLGWIGIAIGLVLIVMVLWSWLSGSTKPDASAPADAPTSDVP